MDSKDTREITDLLQDLSLGIRRTRLRIKQRIIFWCVFLPLFGGIFALATWGTDRTFAECVGWWRWWLGVGFGAVASFVLAGQMALGFTVEEEAKLDFDETGRPWGV